MTASRFIKTAAATVTGLALMTAAASAIEARATTAVNVRSGPSTGYHVVDVLSRGERVNVGTCRSNGWCHVSHHGADGWVSSRYLTQSGSSRPQRRTYRSNNSSEEFMMRFGGPQFSFSIGTGTQRRPARPPVQQHYHQHDHYYHNDGYGGGYNGCYEHNGYTVCE